MSIRPFLMPFRRSCAYLSYDADAALPHLNPRKRRRGGTFIYEKRDHCIISCNSLFIFLINANLLTLAHVATPTKDRPGHFLRAESSPKRPAKVQATSPALRATSSSALRFGNRPALPCGQHLTGQKGPMRGGLGSLCRGAGSSAD